MNDAFHQQQFLNVVDRDEAERRFRAVLDLSPLEAEEVPLSEAHGRVLAADIIAPVDVPGFDRSNMDGFALRAADTIGASEGAPKTLRLNAETVATGIVPRTTVEAGTATAIATGGMLPRGADAVVMIEHTTVTGNDLRLIRPAAPGANISFAGTDIGRGEMVLRRGKFLGSRDTGVLAAIGVSRVPVVRRPCVAVISTGDELIAPGADLRPGLIYDSNATVIADAVRELGGKPVPMGIVPDNFAALEAAVRNAIAECDVVLLSGGTSKGAGDVSYRVLEKLGPPGIVAHGVALKPGKPLCLAAVNQANRRPVPVAVLPGFPTSAIFTFHEFLTPVIRALAGRRKESSVSIPATLPLRVNSERGRTEYLLASLVELPKTDGSSPNYSAYPMGKGSGSVTAFSRADGFVVIPRQREYLEAGEKVEVQLLDSSLRPADLVVIGSHCTGLDFLLGRLHADGITTKFLAVGSTGGLEAAKRGECDLAGMHLLDADTDDYNRPFLTPELELIPGYGRLQGIVFKPGDGRFERRSADEAVAAAFADPNCLMINRNRGSGTRILIDRLLNGVQPTGYLVEARSHNAVAAAVTQGRADWGVAIAPVARDSGLGFIPLRAEQYDFVVPKSRRNRPAVQAFERLLTRPETRAALASMGFLSE
jgi:putative molybdopterin biosynthesis protein